MTASPTKTHMLIATDLSDNANAALETGAALAKQLKARITLVHCINPIPMVPPMGVGHAQEVTLSIEREIREATERSLEELRSSHFAGFPDVTAVVLSGTSTAATLCDYAKTEKADWIVVGTHGRTGLSHMLIGSVAERVARHAPCSVVIARTPQ